MIAIFKPAVASNCHYLIAATARPKAALAPQAALLLATALLISGSAAGGTWGGLWVGVCCCCWLWQADNLLGLLALEELLGKELRLRLQTQQHHKT